DRTLVEGGPGWCFTVDRPPERFGVNKRTNCLLVLDRDLARENTIGNGRINVLEERDWASDELEYEPTETITPSTVRVPLLGRGSNRNTVQPAVPVVEIVARS
ncbi:NADH dehydrogenase subunit, partial [Halobacteriales archaeon QH_10_67_13]